MYKNNNNKSLNPRPGWKEDLNNRQIIERSKKKYLVKIEEMSAMAMGSSFHKDPNKLQNVQFKESFDIFTRRGRGGELWAIFCCSP